MSRLTFEWSPEYESSMDQEPSVTTTKFGDGYELRNANGINNDPQKWTLQFSTSNKDAQDALDFIRQRNAVESFYWTNPLQETGVYVCRKWKLQRKRGVNVLSMEFEQVYEV
jgi:phage-related protein